MSAISRFLLFLCLGFVWRISAQTTSDLGAHIDILHTSIALQFDWENRQASGETTISLRLLAPARSFSLAASELEIKSVQTTDSQNLAFDYKPGSTQIGIQLGRECSAGETLSVVIAYNTLHHNNSDPNAPGGSFGKGLRFFSPTAVNPVKRKQVWSQGELQNNSYWFPCSPHISDLHTSEFVATVDSGLTVVSNGKLVDMSVAPGGQRTFH